MLMSFIQQYWVFFLLFVIIFIVIPLIMVWKRKWSALRAYVFKIMYIVEHEFAGTKQGQEKMDKVLTTVYLQLVPPWAQPFITKNMVRKFIQWCFNEIKDILNKTNPPANQLPPE